MASESASASSSGDPSRVSIRTFTNRQAADLAGAQLRANGIECWISADDCGGLLANLSMAEGVHVLVSRSDEEAAKALLDTPVAPEIPSPNEASPVNPPPAIRPPGRLSAVQILLGFAAGLLAMWLFQSHRGYPPRVTHYDYTADGKRSEEYIYHQGVLTEHRKDRNLDGKWDYWAVYGDQDVQHISYDNNFDGQPDETFFYSNRDLVTLQKDNDFNGIPDEFCTYKYSVIQEMDMRPNDSKFTTVKEIFTNGVVSELWRGGDSNGHFKEVVKYGPFFDPISTNTIPEYPLLSVPQSAAP